MDAKKYLMTYLDQIPGKVTLRIEQSFKARSDDHSWEVAKELIAKFQSDARNSEIEKTYVLVDVRPDQS